MIRFSHHAVGVQRGSRVLFSAFADGGAMWTGHGPRVERVWIEFDESYLETPIVQIGLSMWDIDGGRNQRVDISAEEISREGFVAVFKTWEDTRVARVRADWLAIGATTFEDDWDGV